MPLKFQCRRAAAEDIKAIKEIEVENNLSSWSENDYSSELSEKNSLFFVAAANNKVIGFIVARLIMNQFLVIEDSKKNDFGNNNKLFNETNTVKNTTDHQSDGNELEIYNIGVSVEYKRKGVGQCLLNAVLDSSQKYNVSSIWLEVRASNTPAVKFYESNGFVIRYKRKNFYMMPSEDALVMSKTI